METILLISKNIMTMVGILTVLKWAFLSIILSVVGIERKDSEVVDETSMTEEEEAEWMHHFNEWAEKGKRHKSKAISNLSKKVQKFLKNDV